MTAGPDPLDRLAHEMTGEPILGPRQAALVDAYIARLHAGYPLTQPDMVVFLNVATALGIAALQAQQVAAAAETATPAVPPTNQTT